MSNVHNFCSLSIMVCLCYFLTQNHFILFFFFLQQYPLHLSPVSFFLLSFPSQIFSPLCSYYFLVPCLYSRLPPIGRGCQPGWCRILVRRRGWWRWWWHTNWDTAWGSTTTKMSKAVAAPPTPASWPASGGEEMHRERERQTVSQSVT